MKKADLHIHTIGSDGRYNLDYLLEKYSQAGYDVVVIPDHLTIADSIRNNDVVKLKEEKYGVNSHLNHYRAIKNFKILFISFKIYIFLENKQINKFCILI